MSSRTRRLAVGLGAAIFVAVVVTQSWGGQPLTLNSLLGATISGIATGSIYAVAASGLVVTYTTSGIFNFAQGAIGMVMAFLYWELRVNQHWSAPVALFVVLVIAAPLFGAVIERVIMRRLQYAPI